MGKKDKAEMAKQQAGFVEGAVKNGVKKEEAAYIFELVDKFAGYGFNKSHAAAYALVSYHTAYMKANYREEFLAASMTLDAGNTDKLAMFAAEAKKSGIRVLPPCVNTSGVEFLGRTAEEGRGARRHPLFAGSAEEHRRSRRGDHRRRAATRRGPYKSLADFASRLNTEGASTSARSKRSRLPVPSTRFENEPRARLCQRGAA